MAEFPVRKSKLCSFAFEMSSLIIVILTQYLEDNERLIRYILECINAGRVEEAVTQQQRLQQNLMWLAGIADSQAPPTPSASAPSQVHSPPCFITPSAPTNSTILNVPNSSFGVSLITSDSMHLAWLGRPAADQQAG